MAYKIDSKSPVNEMIGLNITGDVIPPNWYKHIKRKNGKPYLLACLILSDIVYWYRPTENRDEQTGRSLGYQKKFKADKLQRSYRAFAEKFGVTKREVTAAVIHLESIGLVDRDFRTIIVNGTKLGNVLFIGLNAKRLKQITFNDKTDTGAADNNLPSHVETSEGSRSNVIGVTLKRETNTETSQRVPNTQDAPSAAVCVSPLSNSDSDTNIEGTADKTDRPSESADTIQALAVQFSKLTDIPIPTNSKRYNRMWARPCGDILQLCDGDVQVALLLIERTVNDMKRRGINYKAPSSLVNIAKRLHERTANIGNEPNTADGAVLEAVWSTYQAIRSKAKRVQECDDRIVATIRKIGMPNFTTLKAKDKPTFDKRILTTYQSVEVAL